MLNQDEQNLFAAPADVVAEVLLEANGDILEAITLRDLHVGLVRQTALQDAFEQLQFTQLRMLTFISSSGINDWLPFIAHHVFPNLAFLRLSHTDVDLDLLSRALFTRAHGGQRDITLEMVLSFDKRPAEEDIFYYTSLDRHDEFLAAGVPSKTLSWATIFAVAGGVHFLNCFCHDSRNTCNEHYAPHVVYKINTNDESSSSDGEDWDTCSDVDDSGEEVPSSDMEMNVSSDCE